MGSLVFTSLLVLLFVAVHTLCHFILVLVKMPRNNTHWHFLSLENV